jgi:hypothetical protein
MPICCRYHHCQTRRRRRSWTIRQVDASTVGLSLSAAETAPFRETIRARGRQPDHGVQLTRSAVTFGFSPISAGAPTLDSRTLSSVHQHIHIEDQLYPKRAHYHKYVAHAIPREEFVAKIKYACMRRD